MIKICNKCKTENFSKDSLCCHCGNYLGLKLEDNLSNLTISQLKEILTTLTQLCHEVCKDMLKNKELIEKLQEEVKDLQNLTSANIRYYQ